MRKGWCVILVGMCPGDAWPRILWWDGRRWRKTEGPVMIFRSRLRAWFEERFRVPVKETWTTAIFSRTWSPKAWIPRRPRRMIPW